MRCACDVDCQLGQRRGCSPPAHQQNFIPTDLHSRCFFCISTPKRPQKCWPVKIWVFRCVCWKVCWFGFYGLESPHKFSRTVFRFAWAACDFHKHSTIGWDISSKCVGHGRKFKSVMSGPVNVTPQIPNPTTGFATKKVPSWLGNAPPIAAATQSSSTFLSPWPINAWAVSPQESES